jgi:hypothetical protein
MLWAFAIVAALLMGWALLFTHGLIKVNQGGKTIYAGLLSGLAFLVAAGTLIAALAMQRWAVIPAAVLPGVMALASDLIKQRQRKR